MPINSGQALVVVKVGVSYVDHVVILNVCTSNILTLSDKNTYSMNCLQIFKSIDMFYFFVSGSCQVEWENWIDTEKNAEA